jgi:hypothetical protein
MKTPYREYPLYARDINPENGDVIMGELNPPLYDARWKRKNRVTQLKRSLHRYRDCTNLPFYCHELHAYKLLQELNRPTEKSPVKKWESYVLELSEIIAHLEEARTWAHLVKREKQEEEAKRKKQNNA